MLNGITLGIVMIVILVIGSFILTLLINAFLVPLFKTPKEILEEIVEYMNLTKDDHIVDLGSGDGRLLLKAHRISRCKCTGYDISPIMLIIARTKRYLQFPFTKDILFEPEDIFNVDLKNFTKVYCYLDRKSMEILKDDFKEYVSSGGEVYSYMYEIPGIDSTSVLLKNQKKLFLYKGS